MLKRLIISAITILLLSSASLAISHAQSIPFRNLFVAISSYNDDPFVSDSVTGTMDQSKFSRNDQGKLMLQSSTVSTIEESKIFRINKDTVEAIPFAWNPWAEELKVANDAGNFAYPNEPRFPLHIPERGPDGKIVVVDGLQVWQQRDLHRGINTVFHAANSVKDASDAWAKRDISWGVNGLLEIEAHAFIDLNAFYSPSADQLFFGVVPYRLRGETDIKMFETATSYDFAAHESGHAIEHALKRYLDLTNWSYRNWAESFADQMSMWTSLRDAGRVEKLLQRTNGNLAQSNDLSRFGEAEAALTGIGDSARDAINNKTVSTTTDEVHDRSTVLTGAMYNLFLFVYSEYSEKHGQARGLREASDVMGTFLIRAVDYSPENVITLDDMVKAYLKVDKELFDYKYNGFLVDEFRKRELLTQQTLNEWLNHEASIPALKLPGKYSDRKFDKFIADNLDLLGIGPNFGLKPLDVIQEDRFKNKNGLEETIVHVQLTQGRGNGATILDNHGILVFRGDGSLAEWHSPMPNGIIHTPGGSDGPVESKSLAVLSRAKADKLDQHDVPVKLVARPDGSVRAEAHVMRGKGLNAYLEVFTSDNPAGERREIMLGPLPPSQQKLIPIDLN